MSSIATTAVPLGSGRVDVVGRDAVLGGRFQLEDEIGRGGMGAVYRAEDVLTGELVAVKVLGVGADFSEDGVRRFEREWQIIANLESQHVVRFIQRGALRSGRPWFAMELLRGSTLRSVADARGRVDVATALRWAAQICDVVGEAHAAGIVHRDIKLDNVFLAQTANGRCIKVLDFGLAKKRLDGGTLTGPAVLMGTPRYMAPEQFVNARDADARSDVWSIGVCLYRLLAGRYPFEAPNLVRYAQAISREAPPSMTKSVAELPAWLDAIVLKCLANAPEARFADAREVAAALETARSNAQGADLEQDPFFALTPPTYHRASVTRLFAQERDTVCDRPTKRASGRASP